MLSSKTLKRHIKYFKFDFCYLLTKSAVKMKYVVFSMKIYNLQCYAIDLLTIDAPRTFYPSVVHQRFVIQQG